VLKKGIAYGTGTRPFQDTAVESTTEKSYVYSNILIAAFFLKAAI